MVATISPARHLGAAIRILRFRGKAGADLPIKKLQFIFLPYLSLGLFSGVVVFPQRGAHSLRGPVALTILVAAHIFLLGLAALIIKLSTRGDGSQRFSLSRSVLCVGFLLTYLAGFGIPIITRVSI